MKEFGNNTPEENRSDNSRSKAEFPPSQHMDLFPIDAAVTLSAIDELKKRISTSNEENVAGESLKKMYKKNEALFNDTIKSALKMKEDPKLEDVVFGYLLGSATGYEILEKQALVRARTVPTVSQEVIDTYSKAAEEIKLSDDEIIERFWDGIGISSEKDSGFSLPLQEAALEIKTPESQKGFLLGAFDVYLKIREAEMQPGDSK